MARVSIAYGPPGDKGVTSIMSVGADDVLAPSSLERLGATGGKVAIGVWLLGVATGNRALGRLAFWGGLASLGAQILGRHR